MPPIWSKKASLVGAFFIIKRFQLGLQLGFQLGLQLGYFYAIV